MKVRCITINTHDPWGGNSNSPQMGLTLLKEYNVVSKEHTSGGHYYKIKNDKGNVMGYWTTYFEIVPENLQSGWKYCPCGTLTSKNKCCECNPV